MISAEANNKDGTIHKSSIGDFLSNDMLFHDIHRRPIRSFENVIPAEILLACTERDRDRIK